MAVVKSNIVKDVKKGPILGHLAKATNMVKCVKAAVYWDSIYEVALGGHGPDLNVGHTSDMRVAAGVR